MNRHRVFPDRVELCGVAIFLDPESKRRKALDLLAARRKNGLPPYSGEELEGEFGLAKGGAGGLIRDLRDRIASVLLDRGKIECGEEDLICGGKGEGYRLSNKLTVQDKTGAESKG